MIADDSTPTDWAAIDASSCRPSMVLMALPGSLPGQKRLPRQSLRRSSDSCRPRLDEKRPKRRSVAVATQSSSTAPSRRSPSPAPDRARAPRDLC